jgi:hypothetical protein
MQKQSATQQSAIQDDRSVKSQSKPQAGSQTFDPVCGMDVNPNSSKTEQAQRNGRPTTSVAANAVSSSKLHPRTSATKLDHTNVT